MYNFWFFKLLYAKTIRTPIVNYKQKCDEMSQKVLIPLQLKCFLTYNCQNEGGAESALLLPPEDRTGV